jgi:N-formylglutamate deformylase
MRPIFLDFERVVTARRRSMRRAAEGYHQINTQRRAVLEGKKAGHLRPSQRMIGTNILKEPVMETYLLTPARVPVLLSMPHNGTAIPPELAARLQPHALGSRDTDWLLDRLYGWATDLGIGLINPRYSRYVIDLNRPSDDSALYPGANNTELCPTSAFDLRPLYLPGEVPASEEIQQRIHTYWQPYHQALAGELTRLKAQFDRVVLFDAHSIPSQVPRFFDGQLPDLNLGTAEGRSCDPSMAAVAEEIAAESGYSWVVNGRFKGGYITRAYGQPAQGIHALQLELSQDTYLDETQGLWDPVKAQGIMPVLQELLENLMQWAVQA